VQECDLGGPDGPSNGTGRHSHELLPITMDRMLPVLVEPVNADQERLQAAPPPPARGSGELTSAIVDSATSVRAIASGRSADRLA
jgi:hypothetical protein